MNCGLDNVPEMSARLNTPVPIFKKPFPEPTKITFKILPVFLMTLRFLLSGLVSGIQMRTLRRFAKSWQFWKSMS